MKGLMFKEKIKFFSIQQISYTYLKWLTNNFMSVLIMRAWHRLASVVLHVYRTLEAHCMTFVQEAQPS